MKKTRIEQALASAFDSLAPKTIFEDIALQVRSAPDERRRVTMTTKKKTNIIRFIAPAAAACLLLTAGVLGGMYYSDNLAVESVIDIDVNPGIELTTNKNDRVLTATAVNDDGTAILDGMDLSKTDLKVAVNAIIGSMVQKGYMVDEASGILVTVKNKDAQKAAALRNAVLADISASLIQYQVNTPVLNQVVTDSTAVEPFAEENGISIGKALFIQNLIAKDSSLDATQLADKSIRELAQLVIDKKLDIRDIIDYDADDSIWENIADTIEDVNENTATAVPSDRLTAAEAKAKALQHAGVSADEAIFIKAELDKDDGVYHYDIEFAVGLLEYEYEIHATTGQLLDAEKERENDDDRPVTTSSTRTSSATPSVRTSSTASSAGRLTADEAKNKALSHAQVTATEAAFIKVELDEDDGVYHYDIEFRVSTVEYEYEIHATTGQILSAEKEPVDD